MGDSIENKAEEQQAENNDSGGFDFSSAEELLNGAASEKPSENTLEGEIETSEDLAKMQSRAVVGLMDMSFKFCGASAYDDGVYKDGERHITPAIVRLNFKVPAFEVLNAVVWLGLRLAKSFKEIKQKGVSSAEQKYEQAEQ